MAQIKWSERAMNEYRLCLQYSQEEFGTKAAKRFFENVLKRTRRLERYPLTGFIEPMLADRPEGFRGSIIQKNFKLIYHYVKQDETVYIDDIWDTRREPKKLLARLER